MMQTWKDKPFLELSILEQCEMWATENRKWLRKEVVSQEATNTTHLTVALYKVETGAAP